RPVVSLAGARRSPLWTGDERRYRTSRQRWRRTGVNPLTPQPAAGATSLIRALRGAESVSARSSALVAAYAKQQRDLSPRCVERKFDELFDREPALLVTRRRPFRHLECRAITFQRDAIARHGVA